MTQLWADGAYQGGFGAWVREQLGWSVTIVRKPRRWVWATTD